MSLFEAINKAKESGNCAPLPKELTNQEKIEIADCFSLLDSIKKLHALRGSWSLSYKKTYCEQLRSERLRGRLK